MTDVALRLKEEALRLSEEDRLDLAHALWDSLECPDDDITEDDVAWVAELNRRADDLDSGRAVAEPAQQVLAELRDEALRENCSR
jgi:putative addiction module component (TIGR02574 family)